MRRGRLRGQELARVAEREPLRRRAAGPLLLAALAALFLGRALFTGDVLLPGGYLYHFQPWQSQAQAPPQEHWNALAWDAVAQYYPWRAYAHDAISHGVIPLWNPYQFCGTPFVANGQSAVFYPLNVIFYVMDPARAFAISAALHLLLAGLFTYLFLRALGLGLFGSTFGGMTFAFCGFFAAWLQLPTVLDTAIWLPLALFFIARYRATHHFGCVIGLGLSLGTALLAGHPQMFLYVAGVAGAYFVFGWLSDGTGHRRTARWVTGGLAAGGMAVLWGAVQLLPTAELLPLSHRATTATSAGYAAFVRSAMPWQQLITLLLPEFTGNPVYGTYWGRGNFAEYAAYVGVVPLVLAVLGVIWRRDRQAAFFAAVALFSLLVALGTPFSTVVYRLPGFSSTGGPTRMLFLYSAAVAVLAGMGADASARALAEAGAARRLARHLTIAAASVLVATAAFTAAISAVYRVPVASLLSAPALNLLVMVLTLSAAVAALWVACRRSGGPRALSNEALGVLLLASALDLLSSGAGYYRTAPRASVYPKTELTTYLADRASGRVMPLYRKWSLDDFPRAVLPPNSAMVYGLHDMQGYDSLYLARYRQVLAAVEQHNPSPLANGNMLLGRPSAPALLKVLGVQYVLSEAPLDAPGVVLERPGQVNVYRVENFLPRAYVARRAVAASDQRGSLSRLDISSQGQVVLETKGPLQQTDATASGSGVSHAEMGLNLVRLRAERPGYVVLSDAYYPGWRAWVGGWPAEILPANAAFRAVWAGPGQHNVEMRFEPTSFRFGLFATLIAAVIGAAALGLRIGRRGH